VTKNTCCASKRWLPYALEAAADRAEIRALRGEFTDAAMMRDCDRFASLFTHDGV
jgi:hypothetical protein